MMVQRHEFMGKRMIEQDVRIAEFLRPVLEANRRK